MGISALSSLTVRVRLGGLVGGAPGETGTGPCDAITRALHAIEQTRLQLVVVALRLRRLPVSSRRPTLLSSDL